MGCTRIRSPGSTWSTSCAPSRTCTINFSFGCFAIRPAARCWSRPRCCGRDCSLPATRSIPNTPTRLWTPWCWSGIAWADWCPRCRSPARTTCCGAKWPCSRSARCGASTELQERLAPRILFRAGADGQTGRIHRHSAPRQRIGAAARGLRRERPGQFRIRPRTTNTGNSWTKIATFSSRCVQRHQPTTIDLLDPESPVPAGSGPDAGELRDAPALDHRHRRHQPLGAGRRRGSGFERPSTAATASCSSPPNTRSCIGIPRRSQKSPGFLRLHAAEVDQATACRRAR